MARRRFLLLALVAIAVAVTATAARSEQASAAEPQRLFALDAKQGELTPLEGKPGVYRLVLERVRARAIYFTDRPARKVGAVAVGSMLRDLFAGDSPDPNAAVNATGAKRGQLLMGIELRGWHYDARDQKLTLRVRHLPHGGRTIASVLGDVVLPRSFRDVSLFIDNCCGVVAPATFFNTGFLNLTLSINNGPQVEVRGASRETWLPGSAPIGFNPGEPQVGVLGLGPNELAITFEGAVNPIYAPLNLPVGIQYDALQLYFFWGPSGIGVTVLNDGQLIASVVN